MRVTTWLVWFVVLLGLVFAWRLFRWRYRPRVQVAGNLESVMGDQVVRVRNEGAAVARHCRGRLLRIDRRTADGWTRIEPDPELFPLAWRGDSVERDLGPGQEALLVVARDRRLEPGRYRIELAVIDGEEKRLRAEFAVPQPGRDAGAGTFNGEKT